MTEREQKNNLSKILPADVENGCLVRAVRTYTNTFLQRQDCAPVATRPGHVVETCGALQKRRDERRRSTHEQDDIPHARRRGCVGGRGWSEVRESWHRGARAGARGDRRRLAGGRQALLPTARHVTARSIGLERMKIVVDPSSDPCRFRDDSASSRKGSTCPSTSAAVQGRSDVNKTLPCEWKGHAAT